MTSCKVFAAVKQRKQLFSLRVKTAKAVKFAYGVRAVLFFLFG